MSLDVLMYSGINAEYYTIENIYEEDAIFFRENGIRISMWQEMEDSSPCFVVNAEIDMSHTTDTGDSLVEVTEKHNGRSCKDTLKSVREKCEGILAG